MLDLDEFEHNTRIGRQHRRLAGAWIPRSWLASAACATTGGTPYLLRRGAGRVNRGWAFRLMVSWAGGSRSISAGDHAAYVLLAGDTLDITHHGESADSTVGSEAANRPIPPAPRREPPTQHPAGRAPVRRHAFRPEILAAVTVGGRRPPYDYSHLLDVDSCPHTAGLNAHQACGRLATPTGPSCRPAFDFLNPHENASTELQMVSSTTSRNEQATDEGRPSICPSTGYTCGLWGSAPRSRAGEVGRATNRYEDTRPQRLPRLGQRAGAPCS